MSRPAARPQYKDEDDLAIQTADFLRVALPPEIQWWHTPNGGSRATREVYSKRQGKMIRISPEATRFKRMGVRPGVYDLIFIMPNGQAGFIELKVWPNDRSDDQIIFGRDVSASGCGIATCWSLDEVVEVLSRWLALYGLKLRARAA